MSGEVRVEHRYPAAMDFLRTYGPDTLAVLHDVLANAEWRDGQVVARASVRQIAQRLGFVSKDTVHRRLRQLIGAGVLRRCELAAAPSPAYVIDLTATAISATAISVALPVPTSPRTLPTASPTDLHPRTAPCTHRLPPS